jgi:hypothetical protein
MEELRSSFNNQINEQKEENEKRLKKQEETFAALQLTDSKRHADTLSDLRKSYETQIEQLKTSFKEQLEQAKQTH